MKIRAQKRKRARALGFRSASVLGPVNRANQLRIRLTRLLGGNAVGVDMNAGGFSEGVSKTIKLEAEFIAEQRNARCAPGESVVAAAQRRYTAARRLDAIFQAGEDVMQARVGM